MQMKTIRTEVLEIAYLDHGRIVVPEVGHFPHREAPAIVAAAIMRWLQHHRQGTG
jgi:pimeloyl-ACP methyl ester carboxylesterase